VVNEQPTHNKFVSHFDFVILDYGTSVLYMAINGLLHVFHKRLSYGEAALKPVRKFQF
jgi:hypothetical protein